VALMLMRERRKGVFQLERLELKVLAPQQVHLPPPMLGLVLLV
jgi:hypothetical protein